MNDRQRTEALLFPMFFLNIIECGVREEKRDDDYRRCEACLIEARDAALAGLTDDKREKMRRRAARLHNAITDDYRRNGAHVDKIGLVALYTLQAILDADYLVLEEGSRLAAAINAIIEALSDAFAEERLDASARKHARKMLQQLQAAGYFEGIEMREAA